MGLRLDYKTIQNYKGENVRVPNYSGTGVWEYAAGKSGIDSDTYQAYTQYWENHPYIRNLYHLAEPRTEMVGGGMAPQQEITRPATARYFSGGRQQQDPYAGRRISDYKKKDNFQIDGSGMATWTEKVIDPSAPITKTSFNSPFSGRPNEKTTINPGDAGLNEAYAEASKPVKQLPAWLAGANAGRKFGTSQYQSTGDLVDKEFTGRFLNNALIDEKLYESLSQQERDYYGRTFAEAYGADPNLQGAGQVIDAAYQYRRARSKKKSGIGGALSFAFGGFTGSGAPKPGTPLPEAVPGFNVSGDDSLGGDDSNSRGIYLGVNQAQLDKAYRDKIKRIRSKTGRATTVLTDKQQGLGQWANYLIQWVRSLATW